MSEIALYNSFVGGTRRVCKIFVDNRHPEIQMARRMRNEISTELEPTRRGDGRLRYTDKERAIHRLIASADGAVRTTDVVGAFYRDRRPPTHPRIAVGAILNTLRHKLDFNGHPCGLAKSSRRQVLTRSPGSSSRVPARRRSAPLAPAS